MHYSSLSTEVPVRVLQVLLFRDVDASYDLGMSLWAAFQEVEALYNYDKIRVEFQRVYLADPKSIPPAVRDSIDVDWKRVATTLADESVWRKAKGKLRRTYDQEELARLARTLVGESSKNERMVLLTDVELVPPKGWNYILWSWRQGETATVMSLAPMDPLYWGDSDQHRRSTIKHRARSGCCCAMAKHLRLKRCKQPRCFLFGPVDSVTDLDEMRCIGEGHDLTELVGLGFTPQVADPETVQYLSNQPLSKEGSEDG